MYICKLYRCLVSQKKEYTGCTELTAVLYSYNIFFNTCVYKGSGRQPHVGAAWRSHRWAVPAPPLGQALGHINSGRCHFDRGRFYVPGAETADVAASIALPRGKSSRIQKYCTTHHASPAQNRKNILPYTKTCPLDQFSLLITNIFSDFAGAQYICMIFLLEERVLLF